MGHFHNALDTDCSDPHRCGLKDSCSGCYSRLPSSTESHVKSLPLGFVGRFPKTMESFSTTETLLVVDYDLDARATDAIDWGI